MATEIFKTIAELEYKVNGDGLDKTLNFLDKQIEKSKILESQINRLNRLQADNPGLAASQKYIDILGKTQKELVGVTNGIQNVFLKNNDFNKSLIQTVGYAEAAKLKLAALSKSQSISPSNEGQNAIGVLKNSLPDGGASVLANFKAPILNQLNEALPISQELLGVFGQYAPLVGAAAGAAYLLYQYFTDVSDEAKFLARQQEIFSEGLAKGVSKAADFKVEMSELGNSFLLAEKGLISEDAALKNYNKTMGASAGYAKTFAEAKEKYIRLGPALLQLITLEAQAESYKQIAKEQFAEAARKRILKKDDPGFLIKVGNTIDVLTSSRPDGKSRLEAIQELNKKESAEQSERNAKDADRNGTEALRLANEQVLKNAEFAKANGLSYIPLPVPDTPKTKEKIEKSAKDTARVIKNIFAEEFAKLEQQLANTNLKVEISPKLIEGKFATDLEKEFLRINNFLKEGSVTKNQSVKLKDKATEINKALLDKALEDYKGDVEVIQKGFADKIKELKDKDTVLDLAALSDGFEKETKQIEFESAKSLERLTEEKDKLLIKAEEDLKKFTDPQVQINIKKSVEQINQNFDALKIDLETERFNKLRVAAEKAFDKIKEKISETTSLNKTGAETADNKEIDGLLKNFIDNGGNIDKVRKQITDIRKAQNVENIKASINERQQKIEANSKELGEKPKPIFDEKGDLVLDKNGNVKTVGITTERLEKLKKENAQYEKENSELQIQLDEAGITKKEDRQKTIIKNIGYGVQIEEAFVSAVSKILAAQEANIDKEISIQEKRIERTKAIAERGNAELLEQEEERLRRNQELKERYARQQLALQLVQQAGALTLAIAQAAAVPFPANIPAIASIIATVGAGFATVKQLSADNTPRFKDGVVDFRGQGTATSDDNLVRISNRESVVVAKAIEHADNRVILEGMNKGYRYNLSKQIDNSIYKGVHATTQTHNYEDLKQEIIGLREDMKGRKPTEINMDKKAILTVVEDITTQQRIKWHV
ncbi:MAG: hypothetical protein ACEQSR_12885 [Candidatus Methylacidiphilales bacterium]